MKKLLLITLIPLFSTIILPVTKVCGARHSGVYTNPNLQNLIPPEFPGGQSAFSEYLSKNLKWPEKDGGDSQGIVVISFFVEKDGRLTNIIVKKSMAPIFDAEALRVIRKSPRWVPAMRNDRPIKSKYSVPITFFISK